MLCWVLCSPPCLEKNPWQELQEWSLGKMSGRSLEEVMMGMSMDSTMEGMGGSIGDFSPGNMELGGFDGQGESIENKENGGTQPIKCPMSPAQRIKRDRDRAASYNARQRGISVGSQPDHPAQKMRQGPGPGSLKSDTDVLGWSISPSMLDDEI